MHLVCLHVNRHRRLEVACTVETKDEELLLNKTARGQPKTACGEGMHKKMITVNAVICFLRCT